MFAWAAGVSFAVAALRDLGWRSIDNVLVILSLLSWVGFVAGRGGGLPDLASTLAVGGAAFVVMTLFFALGWIGGGDVKLALPVFLWAGSENALAILVVVTACGTVLGLLGGVAAYLCRFSLPVPVVRTLNIVSADRGVPYGVALSAGGILAVMAASARA